LAQQLGSIPKPAARGTLIPKATPARPGDPSSAHLLQPGFPENLEGKMLRRFTDADGVVWNVWDVTAGIQIGSLPPTSVSGQSSPAAWLCFASENKRKRLAPIPKDWLTADEARLLEYCSEAAPVRQRVTRPG
jgi:hypothetical protein